MRHSLNSALIVGQRQQNTLKQPAHFTGIGLHTGNLVEMRFLPAPANTGVIFKRVDLPEQTIIPAALSSVCDTTRNNTTVGIGNARILTVEHVLAAVRAFSIDNLYIEISSIEPPVGNGSSDVFVAMIEKAGVLPQEAIKPIVAIQEPIHYSDKDISIVALPSSEYRISYVLDYPEPKALRSQFYSVVVNTENFKNEIAPCRTFSRYEEVIGMMDKGLIKGGSLDNGVLIKDSIILSKEGLFFKNEMVRHKILDVIGDLFLTEIDFLAHIIAIRSGHHSNYHFAQKLFNYAVQPQTEKQ